MKKVFQPPFRIDENPRAHGMIVGIFDADDAFVGCAGSRKEAEVWIEDLTVKAAATALGKIKSKKKAAAARENGKKGGRPVRS